MFTRFPEFVTLGLLIAAQALLPALAEPVDEASAGKAIQKVASEPDPPLKIAQLEKFTASTFDLSDRIDKLTKKIMLDEIALAKFNVHFRQQAARQGRWKSFRYFLFNQANGGLGGAGSTVAAAERLGHTYRQNFNNLHRIALLRGNVCGGVGQIIGASGSMNEFMINNYHALRAANAGYSAFNATAVVKKAVKQIDADLKERAQLVMQERGVSKCAADVHDAEGRVLEDTKALLASEFAGYRSSARRTFVTQQSFYLLDVARNVTGALSNLYGYKAVFFRNRLFNQQAGALMLVSGGFLMMDPIVSRLFGRAELAFDEYLLRKQGLPRIHGLEEQLNKDYDALEAACKEGVTNAEKATATVTSRLEVFDKHSDRFDSQLVARQKEESQGNRVATQNILSGLFIGGMKIGNGVPFTLAGFKYFNSARRTNVLLGAGAVPSVAGSFYGVFDNFRIQINREITYQKQKRKHQTPAELLKKQLDDLDNLEKQVQAL